MSQWGRLKINETDPLNGPRRDRNWAL